MLSGLQVKTICRFIGSVCFVSWGKCCICDGCAGAINLCLVEDDWLMWSQDKYDMQREEATDSVFESLFMVTVAEMPLLMLQHQIWWDNTKRRAGWPGGLEGRVSNPNTWICNRLAGCTKLRAGHQGGPAGCTLVLSCTTKRAGRLH